MRGNSYRMEIFNFPPYISSIFRKKQGPVSAVVFKYNSKTGPLIKFIIEPKKHILEPTKQPIKR